MKLNRDVICVIGAGIFLGTIFFGAQVFVNMGLSLYESIFFTIIFGLILLPVVILRKKSRIKRGMVTFLAFLGFFGAVTKLSEFGGIALGVPVAMTVLLIFTQPLWTIILGKLLLNEKINRYKILAVFLVIAGVAILLNPFTGSGTGSPAGIFVALIGGVSLSCWVIYGRKGGIKKYDTTATVFGYIIFTLLFVAISYPIASAFVSNPALTRVSFDIPPVTWLYLFVFSMVSTVIPYYLVFRGERGVSASATGTILLLEPLSASALALVFLGQAITINTLAGGFLILVSNYIMLRNEKR
jgi:DME family drug/metabolite transporter